VVTLATWDEDATSNDRAAPRASGAQLFAAKGCASCHDGPTSTAVVSGFPSLAHVSDWADERRPDMSAAEYVEESIRSPGAFISPVFTGAVGPIQAMPLLGLSDQEIDILVDYLLGP
jgi:mono/diheme cytochrome c family protein